MSNGDNEEQAPQEQPVSEQPSQPAPEQPTPAPREPDVNEYSERAPIRGDEIKAIVSPPPSEDNPPTHDDD